MRTTTQAAFLAWLIFSPALFCAQDIFIASYNGDLEAVKRLIEQDPKLVNSRNSLGRFPLEIAAQTGRMEIVRFLLEKGADVNLNRDGSTALHMAALYGGKTELVVLLLEKGADMNARTKRGDTPLNLAVIGGQRAIADLLLDRGAKINLENQDFTRLLAMAAAAGIKRIVEIALTKEVDFFIKTGTGATLLHSAAEGGLTELADTLLSKRLDIGAADIYGETALHVAAKGGHKDIAALLLKKGAEIDARTKAGKTPLYLAREKGHGDVVDFLIERGADPAEWVFPELTGKYLGQAPPRETPVMFAPGIISAKDHFEHSCLAFSPDYSEVFWSTDFTEFGFYDIVFMKKEEGKWSAPGLAPFSEKHHAGSPVFSTDGKKLYFSSTRPRSGNAGTSDGNIWVVERTGNGWSEPKPLNEIINTEKGEAVLGVTVNGVLYFRRDMDVFRSEQKDGLFGIPEKVDVPAPAGARILALWVAPDERSLIIEALGGEGGYGGADLYVSFRRKDGSWSQPVNLGPEINTGGHERFPAITPDGRYLFFLRVTDGSDFFWVDARIIDEIRPKELK
jgi:ankyrin repeat protein